MSSNITHPRPVPPSILSGPLYPAVNVRRRASFMMPAVALLAGVALLGGGQSAQAANTGDVFKTTATDLSVGTNYTTTITPTAATTTDVQFSGSYTGGTTFTINGAALSFGTLDDIDTTQNLVISNTSATAGSITLNTAANSTSGSVAADLLFVKAGANLTLQSGTGTLTLNLANTGNIDDAGTLSLAAPISITAGKTITFTGAGATSITGGIAATTGAITINNAGGSVTLGGTNAETGATILTAGTLNLTGSLTGSGNNITVNGGTFTESGAGVIGTTAGTFILNGGTAALSGLNTYTGATSVNGGTLTLDFSNAAAPTTATDIIKTGNTVNLGGGTLALLGGGSGATNGQTFGTTALTANTASAITLNSNGGTALNLALGGITRNAQSTFDITLPTAGTVTTSTAQAPSNGVLVSSSGVAYGTANGGTTWLSKATGTSPFALTALSTYATGTANYTSANNVDVTTGDAPASGVTVNTLRFNAASDALTLSGVNIVSTGGILVTPSGTGSTISGGTLTSSTGTAEVVVHDYGSVNIGSVIANANAGATATNLTLTGTGTTTLSGANTYTGNTSIDKGTAVLGVTQNGTTSGAFGTGVGTTTVATGATLDLTTSNLTTSAALGTGTITSTAAAGTGGVLTNTGTTNMPNAVTGTAGLAFVRAGTGFGDTLQVSGGTYGYTGGLTITSTTAGAVTGANLLAAGGVSGTSNLTIRFNSVAAVGAGTITLNNGGVHDTATGTYANNIVVGANGGIFHVDGAGGYTSTGTLTGSGFLILQNGFNGAANFSGSNTAFTGTIGVDTANVSSVNLSGAATGSSALSLYFGGSNTAQNGVVQWNGTGSPTIQVGELITGAGNTTTTGIRGSTTAATTVTYQVGDSTANTPVFGGVIANGTGSATTSVTAITKVGTDNQTFSGASTYTGATTVNGGTLTLGVANTLAKTSGISVASTATLALAASNALATPVATTGSLGTTVSAAGQVPVSMGGGTLLRTGAVSLGSQSGTAGTVGIGMLTLTAASTIDYGTTGVGTLNFNGITGLSGTNTLAITDFTTTHPSAMGTDGTDDRFIVNQDLTGSLSFITIDGITPTSEIALGNGEFELSVTPVPEPSTWVAGVLGLGALGLRLRRRLAGVCKRQGTV